MNVDPALVMDNMTPNAELMALQKCNQPHCTLETGCTLTEIHDIEHADELDHQQRLNNALVSFASD